ncbi:hypothetical protein [Lactococcus lactis]|uniref:hypothetical protein n=1 Tax=Lactococcus lactis TaxID=1358 RepID=UPI0035BBC14F
MTEAAKKYTLTAQNIQAYLCELGIKPTEEVSIYSIEYYFDKQTVSTDKLSVEKLQEQLNTVKKALTEISVIPTKFDDGGAGEIAVEIAHEALAAIGGDDGNKD